MLLAVCILSLGLDFRWLAMIVMIFLVGTLLGMLIGAATCVRYLRQEVAAEIGPRLRQIQLQLDGVQSEVALATATRLDELNKRYRQRQAPL
jgi:uncharacterized membrane-anchored protein YhcB (DUF1043 family)